MLFGMSIRPLESIPGLECALAIGGAMPVEELAKDRER
jgi:hypothetical protein